MLLFFKGLACKTMISMGEVSVDDVKWSVVFLSGNAFVLYINLELTC